MVFSVINSWFLELANKEREENLAREFFIPCGYDSECFDWSISTSIRKTSLLGLIYSVNHTATAHRVGWYLLADEE